MQPSCDSRENLSRREVASRVIVRTERERESGRGRERPTGYSFRRRASARHGTAPHGTAPHRTPPQRHIRSSVEFEIFRRNVEVQFRVREQAGHGRCTGGRECAGDHGLFRMQLCGLRQSHRPCAPAAVTRRPTPVCAPDAIVEGERGRWGGLRELIGRRRLIDWHGSPSP